MSIVYTCCVEEFRFASSHSDQSGLSVPPREFDIEGDARKLKLKTEMGRSSGLTGRDRLNPTLC